MSLRAEKLLVSVGIQSLIAGVFLWIESVNGSRAIPEPAWLVTALDRSLPLVPSSVWLYVSWYASPAVLLMLRREDFRRASAAIVAGFLMCAVGYALLPVAMDRPSLDDREGLSAAVLRAVYAIDRPRNIFPSFHAALCAILLAVTPGSTRRRLAIGGWTSAICLSCILTKQHYALDVVAGVAVGVVAVVALDAAKSWRGTQAGGREIVLRIQRYEAFAGNGIRTKP